MFEEGHIQIEKGENQVNSNDPNPSARTSSTRSNFMKGKSDVMSQNALLKTL